MALAIILEILFPGLVLVLVFNLADVVIPRLEVLLEALAGEDVATAMTSSGFIYVLVQLTLIAPLAEELAKPLVILPLARRLSRRQVFLIGAMAGAGFAAMENVIYAGFGLPFWAGILLVRAIGGAIHPLGSGLVAVGWWHGLHRKGAGWAFWLPRFAAAVGIHALWNGGSLIVITLAGARFFGELPPEVDILGLSAAGTTLALLILLGLAALWIGRSVAGRSEEGEGWSLHEFGLSDRAIAIWGLACLVAIVPVGIAGLQILIG